MVVHFEIGLNFVANVVSYLFRYSFIWLLSQRNPPCHLSPGNLIADVVDIYFANIKLHHKQNERKSLQRIEAAVRGADLYFVRHRGIKQYRKSKNV